MFMFMLLYLLDSSVALLAHAFVCTETNAGLVSLRSYRIILC